MAIFDIEKDDLLQLSDTLLEELIARLVEAEVAAHGHMHIVSPHRHGLVAVQMSCSRGPMLLLN